MKFRSFHSEVRFLPVLSENAVLRYLAFGALYFAQGLPEGLWLFAMPAWMAQNGLSAGEIGGFVGIALIPWSLKLVNGPIMDRFTYLPMGRRRPWIMAAQLGLALSLIAFGMIPDPLNNLVWMMGLIFLVNLFSAFQDVAVDGMAIEIVPLDQQARANGLMWGSKVLSYSSSAAICGILLSEYGLWAACLFLAVLIMVIWVMLAFITERVGERKFPWSLGQAAAESTAIQLHDWGNIFRSLWKAFFQPVSILMGVAVFSFSISNGLFNTMMPILTVQDLGWMDTEFSQTLASAGLIGGLFGMFLGGALVDLFGKIRVMSILLILILTLHALLFFSTSFWSSEWVIIGYVIVYQIFYVTLIVAVFATAMEMSWKRIAASQFTLYMAISNFGLSSGASVLGFLNGYLSYAEIFLVMSSLAALMLILLQFVNLSRYAAHIEKLELQTVPVVKMS